MRNHLLLSAAITVVVSVTAISIFFGENKKIFFGFSRGLKSVKNLGRNEVKFIKYAHTAFNLILAKCPNSDEIRPKTFECTNYSGFSSSIVESLEALYLLGLKDDFQKAKEFTLNSFDCNKLGWVNVREFWVRGVGSLIGAYMVSKDKAFLERARSCAKCALEISPIGEPFDYVNFKEKKGQNLMWPNGTIISDLFAGLPEVHAIIKLTGDTELPELVDHLDGIVSLFKGNLPIAFNLTTQTTSMPAKNLDGFNIALLHRLVIALSIKESFELNDAVRQIISLAQIPNNIMMEEYYPLLNIIDMMTDLQEDASFPIQDNLSFYAKAQLIVGKLDGIRVNDQNKVFRFDFETNAMMSLMKHAIKDKNERQLSSIEMTFVQALIHGHSGKGVVGIRSTKNKVVQKGSLMPSNLFGQWLNHGALLYADHKNVIENGVFNERGHLLMCNDIHSFSRTN